MAVGDYGSCEIFEDIGVILPARLGDGEHALDESQSASALASEAALSPEHGAAKRTLGGVVGGLNSLFRGKRPQRIPVGLHVTAEGGHLAVAALGTACDQPAQAGPDGSELLLQSLPVELTTFERLPGVEDARALGQAPPGEACGVSAAKGEPLQVSLEVSPAELPVRAHLVRAPAVTGNNARVAVANKPVKVTFASTSPQVVERGSWGCGRPDPAALVPELPAGLIDSGVLASPHRPPHLPVGGKQCGSRLIGKRLRGAQRRGRHVEQVRAEGLQITPAQAETADQHRTHGDQLRTEVAAGDRSRDLPSGALAAPGTGEQWSSVLGDLGANLRQLDNLMHARPANLGGTIERVVAVAARGRSMLDDLIDALGWEQTAVSASMPLLATTLSSTRPSPVASGARRVGGRRLGRVGGVHREPRLELLDPGLKLMDSSLKRNKGRTHRRRESLARCFELLDYAHGARLAAYSGPNRHRG